VRRARRLRDGIHGRVPALLALAAALCALATCTPNAHASTAATHWSLAAEPEPTVLVPGGIRNTYVLILRNDSAALSLPGEVIAVSDTLPGGVTVEGVSVHGESADVSGQPTYGMSCTTTAPTVTCSYADEAGQTPILPGAVFVITITVAIPQAGLVSGSNTASVSVDGIPDVATPSETPTVGSSPAPFALSSFALQSVGEDGTADTQAGSHPFELSARLLFTVAALEQPSKGNGNTESPLANAAPKGLEVELPPGLVGNPSAVPRCSQRAFLEGEGSSCPLDTQVGTIRPFFYGISHTAVFPVYSVLPPAGYPGELGFSLGPAHVPLLLQLRADGGLTASLQNIPEEGPLQGAILTLWGVPAAGSHDLEREGTRGKGGLESEVCEPSFPSAGSKEAPVLCPSGAAETPFLTLPTDCPGQALGVGVAYEVWEQPGARVALEGALEPSISIDGCEQLSFDPSLAFTPETTQAGAPSGYTLDLHTPQNENPQGLATPSIRAAAVTLPAGVVLSPSVADGLQACTSAQFAAASTTAAGCPRSSQIGTVRITTPLLASPLEGQIFIGEPACSPCDGADAAEGRLLRLLLQAQGAGVTVKLEGSAAIDQATGRLTASFDDSPELPFEDVTLTFDGGPSAPFANPTTCGAQLAASSQLTPYSANTPAEPSSEPFTVGGCQPPQLHPSFTAGTTDNHAGAFSPLTVTLSRTDADASFETLSVALPPGLLATLSDVYPCPQALAHADACPSQSLIGSASIGAGPGSQPLFLDGSVYLTGPYEGAPFGLSILVPALAGPFNLGEIAIGARIDVNPSTAALTITSDPLPQSVDGIPLQLKTIELDIDRQGFVFNPTDCRPLSIGATVGASAVASALVSSPFTAADCATLPFKPKLSALTHAHASKADGVHLHLRILAGRGQANIAKVKLVLPKRIAPRLAALQKACSAAVFAASPRRCAPASVVGTATILTPILRDPLSGPAYVLSRGAAAEPEIGLALAGEGVLIEVIGQTRVEHGFASVVFGSLPDVPFSELDAILESGPHSLLAANLPASAHGDMCSGRLAMPTEVTAQNGAVVKQTTIVSVSGCRRSRQPDGGHKHARSGK
jgi:hypothetical protein